MYQMHSAGQLPPSLIHQIWTVDYQHWRYNNDIHYAYHVKVLRFIKLSRLETGNGGEWTTGRECIVSWARTQSMRFRPVFPADAAKRKRFCTSVLTSESLHSLSTTTNTMPQGRDHRLGQTR